jgi:hypothetical protein
MVEAVVGEWRKYDKKCHECGGDLVIKKNRTGAMATVKHEVPNDNCSFKMGSVKYGGKTGTQRTEKENQENGKSKSGGNNPATGSKAGTATGSGSADNGSGTPSTVDNGQDKGKNIGDEKRSESYSEYLKRQYK